MKNKRKSSSFGNNGWTDKLKSWYFKDKAKVNNWNGVVCLFGLIASVSMIVCLILAKNQGMYGYGWFWVLLALFFLIFIYNLVRWSLNFKKQTRNKKAKHELQNNYKANLSWQQELLREEGLKKQKKFNLRRKEQKQNDENKI